MIFAGKSEVGQQRAGDGGIFSVLTLMHLIIFFTVGTHRKGLISNVFQRRGRWLEQDPRAGRADEE